MGTWISTVTNKGYALQAKLLSTDKLNITRVVSGSGSCAVTQLINQTAVSDIKQELTVNSLSYDKYGNARLNVTLSNIDLNTGYDVNQIGIYATDPDEGEILYAIAQADEAEPIPSISEQPNGFYCSWDFALTYSNAQNINVTIDPSNAISREAADLRYVQLAKIGDNLSVDENGVLSADAQEITVDDALSKDSTNPVQNKVVNTALGNKVDKVSGKGLSTNDYTTDEKNKLSGIAAGANKYTHPSHDAHTTGLYKVEVDSKGHVVSVTKVEKSDITALGIPATDTKNTTGTELVENEVLGLVGAQTFGNSGVETKASMKCYINSDNCLFSNGKRVSVEGHSHDLPIATSTALGGIKVGNGLSISAAGSLSTDVGSAGEGVAAEKFNASGTNVASGTASHAEGSYTKASGSEAHAEGYKTTAGAAYTHAEGNSTSARGQYAHSEGYKTTACGIASHIEGCSDSSAPESYSSSTSNDTIVSDWETTPFALAKGYASHCEGIDCLALGDYSHAEGYTNIAKGLAAHSEGFKTIADGIAAHAEGKYTEALSTQSVVGIYNTTYTGRIADNHIYNDASQTNAATAFIVGCGTSDSSRANALRVTADGQARGLKAFLSSGADFAEYMEWEDGNPDNEDRRGRMVAYALTDAECVVEEIEILDPVTHEKKTIEAVVRDKMPTIRYATSFDECIGVVSSSGAFIGNSASEEWNSRYVRDIFGEKIVQAVLIPEETKTYNTTEIDEETGEEVIVEKTEVIPEHWVKQYVLNPHYDPEAEYIEREHRKEWSPVGFHGQIVAVDDGTCVVGGYCSPAENGIATASETGFRVIQRLDKKHVRLYVE